MSKLVSIAFMLVGIALIGVVVLFLFLGVTGQDIPFMSDEAKVEYEFKKKEMESENLKELMPE